MNISQLHQLFLETSGISTDTRKIEQDALFVALKGDHFNGNKFAQEALGKGAKYVLIDEKEFEISDKTILVEDCLRALQTLANFHRKHLHIPIIALTGSNGKTTTKELIAQVLRTKYKVVATKGNLNNHIGVPLTLLSMDETTEIGVVEMGANHLKEIELLASIAEPNYGYITNFGKAHLEGFGGIEGVIKGKSELYQHLITRNQTIFVNTDDALQVRQSVKAENKITFGSQENTDYKIQILTHQSNASIQYKETVISSNLIGDYNAKNMGVSTAVGLHFGIPIEYTKQAIENYIPENNRSQMIEKNTNQIILDAYNANPTSMELALNNFLRENQNIKVVILGDMFEVGETSLEEHQHIVDMIEKSELKAAFVCGESFYKTSTQKVIKKKNYNDLRDEIEKQLFQNNTILIKGSRGMRLERILEVL
ncbi:UDP-N-acetylmuramoyl-tripeptide--D-alanyl-D-alanine ligase [Mesonia sp. K7]|uniref:UDP-N-acetylmuramoyl-tripeptide--D-alanyl-D- alanine ligase n=1 Tax=Mesonia sp. K7 TaxID=2218606 RepID=UPI000DA70B62|nr:UDP-N-acetylmuramoyl-tripeptide--D-alanyl-D-alanine ligase [Mesonia sp. K7]PZD77155.1 UDP-N-acetylmuramoyl-tripeptide--D-alanyl-D-alanine ligase [Mesonia sp. K7]